MEHCTRKPLPWVLMTAMAIFLALLVSCSGGPFWGPVRTFGPALRAKDRVFLLTGQWRTLFALDDEGPRETDLFVDLWAFDAATAKPLWRRRLQTERNGAMAGRSILGAESSTLWLLLPRGVVAASLTDGAIQADGAGIEARNPQLKGLLLREHRYFQFGPRGLTITAADARAWRLDAGTFLARAVEKDTPPAQRDVVPPAYFTPNFTRMFQQRGLNIPGHWLGLLTNEEAEVFRQKNAIGDLGGESRGRLWRADTGEATNFFGKYTTYSNFRPLGADFLTPGLLSVHDSPGRPRVVWVRNPDSVFVLHRDRLGEDGRWRLARVAGPEGRVLWDAVLPLSVLQSVLPGEKSLVLYGVEFRPPPDDRPRDPMHDAREKLIAIDLTTGRTSVHDQSNVSEHIEAFVPAEASR